MDDLDVVRSRYDDLLSELYGLRGDKPPLRLYAELIGFDKRKAACCRQWLPEIDRRDYYEEAIVGREDGPLPTSPRLSEKTISARLSLMLDSVTGGPQNKEIFRQNLVQYVYGAEVCSLALESACREIEQTGEYPTIAKVLKILKDHQEQWDKRQRALSNIEELRKHYAGKRLKETEDSLRKRQEEARAAYLRVEEAMERLAKDQQRCAEAKAALDAAGAAAKAIDDDRQA
jgi:hypothetical protein